MKVTWEKGIFIGPQNLDPMAPVLQGLMTKILQAWIMLQLCFEKHEAIMSTPGRVWPRDAQAGKI